MFENGRGVEQDFEKAFALYSDAAEKGSWLAVCSLGDMYLKGEGVAASREKAIELYTESAEHGCEEAVEELKKLNAPVPAVKEN